MEVNTLDPPSLDTDLTQDEMLFSNVQYILIFHFSIEFIEYFLDGCLLFKVSNITKYCIRAMYSGIPVMYRAA
jgi:hypothetical protein